MPPKAKKTRKPPVVAPDNYDHNSRYHESLPNYTMSDAWQRFTKVANASLEVANARKRLVLLEKELEQQSKELKKHREQTTKLFKDLHGRSSLGTLNILKRVSSAGSRKGKDEKKNKCREDFETSHHLETQTQQVVNAYEEEKRVLQSTINANVKLACEMNQMFELVAGQVAATLSNTDTEEIRAAEKNVEAQTTAYNKAEKAVSTFNRACVTVQHAHHYFHNALQCLDALRGGFGPLAFSGVSEISKSQDYQEAAALAGKAQVCFNETDRVIMPYVDSMPTEVLLDFKQLKELGLLQPSKMYNLMYSWSSETHGSVKLMSQRMETAFACLTRFAVWVQNEVPVVESGVWKARSIQIAAQKTLVQLWIERYGLSD